MTEITEYKEGSFCWAELATNDANQAKSFYGEMFNWQGIDNPAGDQGVYTMLQVDEKDVAALYGVSEEQKSMGVTPNWGSYIAVDDIDKTVEKAKSLGAQVVMDPMDVMEAGRMAVLTDPIGARFSLWQGKQHIGAGLIGKAGTFCWNELATTDLEASKAFYSELFGWEVTEQKYDGYSYIVFKNGDQQAAGMLQMTDEWKGMDPHWMIYFMVEDCDASVEKAKSLGGESKYPVMEIPDVGRFAMLSDPQGAHFSIISNSAN